VVVVLGGPLVATRSSASQATLRPGSDLSSRLMSAISLLKMNNPCCILLTGGDCARHGTSEAEVMHEYIYRWARLARFRLPRVFIDTRARDTLDNAINTMQILEAHVPRVGSITVVTSDFHANRAMQAFNAVAPKTVLALPIVTLRVERASSGNRAAETTEGRASEELAASRGRMASRLQYLKCAESLREAKRRTDLSYYWAK